MLDVKTIFSTLSVLIGLAVFADYFHALWKREVKPHVYSWLTWAVLGSLGYVLSDAGGGGEGAWVFALQAIGCFAVAGVAVVRGEKNVTRADKVAFAAAMTAMAFYAFTRNAVASVTLGVAIDTFGFFPTFRKSYAKPDDESALTFFLSMLSYLCSIFALSTFSYVTLFYPLTLVFTNGAFVAFLLVRRRAVR